MTTITDSPIIRFFNSHPQFSRNCKICSTILFLMTALGSYSVYSSPRTDTLQNSNVTSQPLSENKVEKNSQQMSNTRVSKKKKFRKTGKNANFLLLLALASGNVVAY
jgi:hypothetical protein